MNAEIEDNRRAFRKVKVAKIVPFEAIVSCFMNAPVDPQSLSRLVQSQGRWREGSIGA
jgi:hypothetical protein